MALPRTAAQRRRRDSNARLVVRLGPRNAAAKRAGRRAAAPKRTTDVKLPAPQPVPQHRQGVNGAQRRRMEPGKEFLEHLFQCKKCSTARAYTTAFRKLVRLNGSSLDGITSASFIKSVQDKSHHLRIVLMEYCRFTCCESAMPKGEAKVGRAAPALNCETRRPPQARCLELPQAPRREPLQAPRREPPQSPRREPRRNPSAVHDITPADNAVIEAFTKSLEEHNYSKVSQNVYRCCIRRLVKDQGNSLDKICSEGFLEQLKQQGQNSQACSSVLAFCRFRGCKFATQRSSETPDPAGPSGVKKTIIQKPAAAPARGRPRKVTNASVASVACRPRGRPRKVIDPSVASVDYRSRGQPRKVTNASVASVACKSRGPPRKVTNASVASVACSSRGPPRKVTVPSVARGSCGSTSAGAAVKRMKREQVDEEASVVIMGFPFAMWKKALIEYAKLACGPLIPQSAHASYDALDSNKFVIVKFASQAAAGKFLEASAAHPLRVTIMFQQHELTAHWASEVFPAGD